ncbi:hypothetical protein ACIGW8_20160 [Streptomyces sioyaensis]|uniref:hypothetical protein n=1 Tax=Streptomyces sioyaensis TaxID=67364 RepID=UPI0037CF233C
MSETTAAEAAGKATTWAHCAEEANKYAHEHEQQAREYATQRESGNATAYASRAEEWGRLRGTAVDMANMWANVAGALQLAEQGEHS